MMLLTPNWSMKLIICFCAPAVMESIATTAPTPKIMPSMVSRLRNLCAKRLASPIFSSGITCPNMALFTPRHRTHRVARSGRLLVLFLGVLFGRGIAQGDNFSDVYAGRQGHHGFAALDQFHFTGCKAAVFLLHVDHVLAVL